MRLFAISALLLLSWFPDATWASSVVHDDRFTPDHVLRVSVAQMSSGCETRENVVVNGASPGPVVRIPPGARTWIRVYNDIPDQNITMHWHGLALRMAPFADGSPMASQWPIPPGHFFDYEIATENDDAGTYFYHSHVGVQAMSCAGPLIVDDCGSAPHHCDDERIMQFQDHFSMSDREMLRGFSGTSRWPGETGGVLLNGKGVAVGHRAVAGPPGGTSGRYGSPQSRQIRPRDGDSDTSDSIYTLCAEDESCSEEGDGTVVEPPNGCTLPVIDVEPGKTYRFRFIGATGLSLVGIAFEGHSELTIVQVDGNEYNVPVTTGHLRLGAGQRFDILFKTKTTEDLKEDGNKTTYFIQFETLSRPQPYRGYGVLRYNINAEVPTPPPNPVLELPTDPDWLEYAFEPLYPEENEAPSAEEVTRRVILDIQQKQDNKTGLGAWELAHLSWTEYTYQKPVLVDIYQRGATAMPDYDVARENHGWDPATVSFPARVGEVLEIVLQNTGSQFGPTLGLVETHPFHAHGQHFYDIGCGPGKYDANANNKKLAETGYRAVRRDTTMVPRYQVRVAPGEPAGWRAWRIRVMNPGVWMIHCHILAHMMLGMQTIWVVGDADQIVQLPLPVSRDYFTFGGSVYGNATHAPRVNHFFAAADKCGLPVDD